MAEPIKMPNLGSDMSEGTLLNWVKNVGDTISAGDVIAEIETDKATVEVPSEVSGTIIELIGELGSTLTVGSTIGYVGAAGEASPAGGSAAPAKQEEKPAPAPEAPKAAEPAAQAKPAESQTPPPSQGATPADQGEDDDSTGSLPDGVKASPIARRIAKDKGINLKQVKGTGPDGRITRADVEGFTPAAAAPAAAPAQAASGIAPASYGELPSGPDVEIIDVSRLRSRIASRMVQSKQQIPHFYVTMDVDVEALLKLRKQLNAVVTDEAQKVTVNDLIVKAAALTLRQYPNLNSHFYGDKIVRHKRINIGIAVALEGGGLMNVVAKDADKTSLGTMAAQNKAMIARARESKVKPEDVQGSTFTVSNLGSYDVDFFQAIVNPPEAGILAISAAKKVPIVLEDGTLGVGNRMKVTVSVDHRVSDGAEGAQFLKAFKDILENPMRLVM
jgi:pyruvate dehydrogenase E2 component (dihydrolipoamide acetyltransferase)